MEFLKILNSSGLKALVEKTKRKSPLLSTSGHVREERKLNGTILFSGDSFGLCLLNKFTEEKSQQPYQILKDLVSSANTCMGLLCPRHSSKHCRYRGKQDIM